MVLKLNDMHWNKDSVLNFKFSSLSGLIVRNPVQWLIVLILDKSIYIDFYRVKTSRPTNFEI